MGQLSFVQGAMTTAIVTDSNSSLPRSMTEGLPLTVVPLEIHHEGKVYRDGVDISVAQFYETLRTASKLPTTSAPSPGAFMQAFRDASAGADEIICVTLSSRLSSTFESAEAAQRAMVDAGTSASIRVVDSLSAGTAQGLIALSAARAAREGLGATELLPMIERWKHTTKLYGYLQSLYYVWKGGRVPRVVMWMSQLLDVKPVLQLADGKIGMVERPRTERRAFDRLVALAVKEADGRPSRIAVMHASALKQSEALAEALRREVAPVELFVTEFTPVIGAHTGPGLVGFAIQAVE